MITKDEIAIFLQSAKEIEEGRSTKIVIGSMARHARIVCEEYEKLRKENVELRMEKARTRADELLRNVKVE